MSHEAPANLGHRAEDQHTLPLAFFSGAVRYAGMFSIELLPAAHGDCIWIEYGAPHAPSRILIDGGTRSTWPTLRQRIEQVPIEQRWLELLVITHIDADHIGGALELLRDTTLGVNYADVWFNGWQHISEGTRGAAQGEAVSALLRSRGISWNRAFNNSAIVVPETGPLPRMVLPGGMQLTLLSPTPRELRKLQESWAKECEAAGIQPGAAEAPELVTTAKKKRRASTDDEEKPEKKKKKAATKLPSFDKLLDDPFVQDSAEANGSSIAFLAEYEGKRVLFTGDAHPWVLASSLARLADEEQRLVVPIDALKLPHHGSKGNLHWELLYRVECSRYLCSTDGGIFDHPDPECLARIIAYAPTRPQLYFTHRSHRTEPWADPALSSQLEYDIILPQQGRDGIKIELSGAGR